MQTESTDNRFKFPYWVPEIGQRIMMVITKPLCHFFLRMKVEGRENIKDIKPGMVFAMNHSSEIDVAILPNTFRLFSKMMPVYIVTRESNFYEKLNTLRSRTYGGNFFRFMGGFPVATGLQNYEKTLAFQIEMLKKGKNVLIFPEGARSKDGKIQQAKGGVIALAKFANAPIVPVAISGILHMTFKEFLLRKRFVKIQFGKPIYPNEIFSEKELEYSEYRDIATNKIMGAVEKMLEGTRLANNEVYS